MTKGHDHDRRSSGDHVRLGETVNLGALVALRSRETVFANFACGQGPMPEPGPAGIGQVSDARNHEARARTRALNL